jgi:putative DNA-invertase from lambdoid prophage Rac
MENKVAIYARVSMQDQHCEVQLRELREYCKRRGWKKPVEYIDQSISGTKASRPALDKLMADAADRQFGILLVWKLDRFGRSVLNLTQQLQRLDAYKIRFIATTQSLDTDAANPTSRLLMHILSAVAEFERELICERTRAGLARARELGKTLGRPMRVFRRDLIASLRAQNMSWREIGKKLGVSTTTVFEARNGSGEHTEKVRAGTRSKIPPPPKPTRKQKQST